MDDVVLSILPALVTLPDKLCNRSDEIPSCLYPQEYIEALSGALFQCLMGSGSRVLGPLEDMNSRGGVHYFTVLIEKLIHCGYARIVLRVWMSYLLERENVRELESHQLLVQVGRFENMKL